MNNPWLAPIAFLYGIVVSIRHKMFDWGWLRSQEYDIPIVCVGNLTVGGTGKTPVVEMLVENLRGQHKIAVLSRGYGRRTKGYLEASVKSSFLNIGDEPKQIKQKFPDIVVAVCEKRTDGIARIMSEHPEVNLIILDDGFQHRYVKPWINIILMDSTRPIYQDHMLPWGNLRDKVSQLHRAHYVIVTKCPPNMTPIDRRIVFKSLKLYPYQQLYFSSMSTGSPLPIFPDATAQRIKDGDKVIAMSGIGNPAAFRTGLEERYDVVDSLEYPDHHPYRRRDLDTMSKLLDDSPEGTVIVTTEKDAVKMMNSKKIPPQLREKLFYIPLKITFYEDSATNFLNKLESDVRTNPKDRFLHS